MTQFIRPDYVPDEAVSFEPLGPGEWVWTMPDGTRGMFVEQVPEPEEAEDTSDE